MKLVLAGAGSIGCFCGALLARSGHSVTLLGRAHVLDLIRERRLTVTDFDGLDYTVPPESLVLSEDPACLGQAELVIVTVKSGATSDMAEQISALAPRDVPVLSWQNGIEAATTLRNALPGRDVRAGMVPFNVVPTAPAT